MRFLSSLLSKKNLLYPSLKSHFNFIITVLGTFFSRHFSKIIIYTSLIFLLTGLYFADYLIKPKVYSWPFLLYSILFLWAGFIVYSLCWGKVVGSEVRDIRKRTIMASAGLSIFGKYIPGRLWVLLGRSAYLEKHSDHPLGFLSLLSFKEQIISIWTGFFLGLIGYNLAGNFSIGGIAGMLLLLGITPFVFSSLLPDLVNKVMKKVLKREVRITPLDGHMIRRVLPYSILNWSLWGIGFYFLAQALLPQNVPLLTGLCFPLAANIGILAFFAPGGVGVRETMVVIYLHQLDVGIAQATTIALASRLWFLFGEAFLFTLGNVAHLARSYWHPAPK